MLEVVSDYPSLLQLEGSWNALAGRFDNPFLRHECAVACAELFCGTKDLAVFVIRTGAEIRAIAPFRAVRRAGVVRLESLSRPIHEPTGLLFADEDALAELLAATLGNRLSLVFGRLAKDGPEMRLLRGRAAGGGVLSLTEREDASIWVPLPADGQALEAAMSSGRRAYVRRKLRQAEKLGPVEMQAFAPAEDEVVPLVDEAFRIEASGWKGRNGTAILQKPKSRRFFTRYCQLAARAGLLRLYFLRIGGEAAAMRIALQHAGRMWEVKIGYDERFHECSPGVILTHLTLKHCCGQGLDAFEFLGLAESWEYAWTDRTHYYASPTLHPSSLHGHLAMLQDVGWSQTKRLLKTLKLDADSRKARARLIPEAATDCAARPRG